MSAPTWQGIELPQADGLEWDTHPAGWLFCCLHGSDKRDYVVRAWPGHVELWRLEFATHQPDGPDNVLVAGLSDAKIVALAFAWADRVKAWVEASPNPAAFADEARP